ncbi:MAG: general glycosylation pathway protein, partial [Candidatus Thermoplasmatota archaeon]|nr:general glycosylation pathway protein [Candidatus Thermoplasmatota archaeon]
AKMAQIGLTADIWAVTDLDETVVRKAMMKPYTDLQNALDDAKAVVTSRGLQPRVIVMPAGSLTVPLVKEEVC